MFIRGRCRSPAEQYVFPGEGSGSCFLLIRCIAPRRSLRGIITRKGRRALTEVVFTRGSINYGPAGPPQYLSAKNLHNGPWPAPSTDFRGHSLAVTNLLFTLGHAADQWKNELMLMRKRAPALLPGLNYWFSELLVVKAVCPPPSIAFGDSTRLKLLYV